VFDYEGYLDFLEANHHNFFRMYVWEHARWASWNNIDGMRFSPHPYPRTGPGEALDGKAKFDVSQFNQAYFDRLRQRVQEAGERNIYVAVMLFNGWSIEDKNKDGNNPWQAHPYNQANNINDVDGDTNDDGQGLEVHSLAIPAITALQEAYVRKVIDTINDLDNVLYEISNESHADATNWQYHIINVIKAYEATKPKQHPVGMTVEYPGGSNDELFASPADWISPNGDISNRPVASGEKVVIADTDHLCGICGDRTWVWSSFTRGENPIFMDVWDCSPWWYPQDCDRQAWPSLRQNLGYAHIYANRMNLGAMTPQPSLASTGYALADSIGGEYLVYQPNSGSFTVDLAGTTGELSVEWFNPESGQATAGAAATGGDTRSFTPPFNGDAVLYLYQEEQAPTHQLYVPIIGNGQVSLEPPGPYTNGQEVTMTALPASGWSFSAWSGDFSGTANPATVIISGDMTVTATFTETPDPATYTTTVSVEGSGLVLVHPEGPYQAGQVVTLTALAAPDWIFSAWSGDVIGSSNPVTFTMIADTVVTATFTPAPAELYTITMGIAGDGAVALSPIQPFSAGQVVTLTALPAPSWHFLAWADAGATNPVSYTIAGNSAVTATFNLDGEGSSDSPVVSSHAAPLTDTHALTLTLNISGDGSVAIFPHHLHDQEQPVRLTAIPPANWQFTSWSGAISGEDNPVTVALTTDAAVLAIFHPVTETHPYTLRVTIVGDGQVITHPPGPYTSGQPVTVTAVPAAGWGFVGWQGDAHGAEISKTLVLTASLDITATFHRLNDAHPYIFHLSTQGAGHIQSKPPGPYQPGQSVLLTAFPDHGWRFAQWSGDLITETNPLTVTALSSYTLIAQFQTNPHFLPFIKR
jgi:hypothetical protein